MDIYNSCCFIGPKNLQSSLDMVHLIQQKFEEYVIHKRVAVVNFGNNPGFEEIAQLATVLTRLYHSHIRRVEFVPQLRTQMKLDVQLGNDWSRFEATRPVWMTRACFKEKGKFIDFELIQSSVYCIFYITGPEDEREINLYKYARMHNRSCINLADYRDSIVVR